MRSLFLRRTSEVPARGAEAPEKQHQTYTIANFFGLLSDEIFSLRLHSPSMPRAAPHISEASRDHIVPEDVKNYYEPPLHRDPEEQTDLLN